MMFFRISPSPDWFEDKMRRLAATLREQVAEGQQLDSLIEANLRELGFGE